jgi:hypothetical protein
MLIIRCSESLPNAGTGFTCLVGVRTLKHMTSSGMVSTMQALGVPYRDLNRTAFLNVLSSLSIPATVVAGSADWSGR